MTKKASQKDKQAGKTFRTIFSRFSLIFLLLLLQIVLVAFFLDQFFSSFFSTLYFIGLAANFFTTLYLINNNDNPAYKTSWTIFLLIFFPFGALIYWFFVWQKRPNQRSKIAREFLEKSNQYLPHQDFTREKIQRLDIYAAKEVTYLQHHYNFPLYQHTASQYFPFGENYFFHLKRQLRSARHFIFLEFFIINEKSQMWQEILNILCAKIEQGVQVRLIYDDFGSLFSVSNNFPQKMAMLGIKTIAFNRFLPFFNLKMNNRDHRKIVIIDNRIAFTGGINLSDRYINLVQPHGIWKDAGLMLTGQAVWTFTVMFLQSWHLNSQSSKTIDFDKFKYDYAQPLPNDGFIQPFSDSPLDTEPISRNLYLNMLHHARDSIIITTPYLIIDSELQATLCLSAKSGLAVKIIVPGIADRKMNKYASEAFYPALIKAGVQIYRYTPGFIHSKTCLVDNHTALIGTINLDYRSFYLNYENGVWLHQTTAVKELKTDLKKTLEQCELITLESLRSAPLPIKAWRYALRLISTLM